MLNIKKPSMVIILIAPLVLVATSFAQDEPRRTITEIADGVYRATNNNHGTVFMVTDEGIVMADPLNTGFSTWLKGELDSRFGVPVRYVVYSHHHWDHATGGGRLRRHGAVRRPRQHAEPPGASTGLDAAVGCRGTILTPGGAGCRR